MLLFKDYITFTNLFFFIFIMLLSLRLITKIKAYLYPKPSLETAKKHHRVLLKYLDKYYVKNAIFTHCMVLLYIIIQLVLLFAFRYIFLGHTANVVPLDTTFITFKMLFILLCLLSCIVISFVCLRSFLNILFFDEILKLYFYYHDTIIYDKYSTFVKSWYLKNFIGPYYLVIDTIANLKEIPDDLFYQDHHQYIDIYHEEHIQELSLKCLSLCKKYKIIFLLFKILQKILRLLYKHCTIDFLFLYISKVLIISILFYDILIIKEIKYIYYILFFTYIATIIYKIYKLEYGTDSILNYKIYKYFYENEEPYKKQRLYLNNVEYYHNYDNILENKTLRSYFQDDGNIRYILNAFTEVSQESDINKNLKSMYLRFCFLVINIILIFYVFLKMQNYSIIIHDNTNTLINIYILMSPVIFLIYFTKNSFKLRKNSTLDEFSCYEYKKIYAALFWLVCMIQFYIFWILLFKQQLILLSDDYLFDKWHVQIMLNYTIEHKLNFVTNYIEFYSKSQGFQEQYLDNLLMYIKEINYIVLVDENITIRELKNYIELLINNYKAYLITYHEGLHENSLLKKEHMLNVNTYMNAFINIINFIVFWEFFKFYINATYICFNPTYNAQFIKLIYTFIKLFNKYK